MVKAIIPAGGWGKRMGMQPNQSKEMLIDPDKDGYLIDYSLNLCYKYNIEPVVITRIEKEDLNSYLRSQNVEHISLKNASKEWADSVLKSKGLWNQYNNLLILPDTRFDEEGFKEVLNTKGNLVIGQHDIDPLESSKWGIVCEDKILEKPKEELGSKAWALLKFHRFIGEGLFESLLDYGEYHWFSPEEVKKVNLKFCKDITRTGTLEKC